MVREVMMKLSLDAEDYNSDVESDRFPCVLQYVLFPPHFPAAELGLSDSDYSSDEDDDQDELIERPARESGGKVDVAAGGAAESARADDVASEAPLLQLVTECWVEPQNGLVAPFVMPPHCPSVAHTPLCHTHHLVGLPYYQLPQAKTSEVAGPVAGQAGAVSGAERTSQRGSRGPLYLMIVPLYLPGTSLPCSTPCLLGSFRLSSRSHTLLSSLPVGSPRTP
ncbi:hypothetical protein FHG87_009136 [Trinorchestia longiramus]|nr:hypothetical protein FHG87_009136 [Trinorchestia longiramus]